MTLSMTRDTCWGNDNDNDNGQLLSEGGAARDLSIIESKAIFPSFYFLT